jgi:hypothetical protein
MVASANSPKLQCRAEGQRAEQARVRLSWLLHRWGARSHAILLYSVVEGKEHKKAVTTLHTAQRIVIEMRLAIKPYAGCPMLAVQAQQQ